MKATMQGKITSMSPRPPPFGGSPDIVVTAEVKGKFEGNPGDARDFTGSITLYVRPMFAEKLKYGQMLTFELNTEEGT